MQEFNWCPMNNTCHVCGAKLTNVREDKDKLKNENSIKLNGDPIKSCKLCGQKLHHEAIKWEDLNSYPSRISSPPISLTSSDSTVSSCSKSFLFLLFFFQFLVE